MRIPTARHALAPPVRALFAAGLALAAGLAVLVPTPARADASAAPVCHTLLQSTPPITVDLDGDGNPDFRSPRITDVTLCAEAGATYATFPPTVERCDPWPATPPTCMRILITLVPVEVAAGATAEVCYTVDGTRICQGVTTPPPPMFPRTTMCIGYDHYGGFPCGGSIVTLD